MESVKAAFQNESAIKDRLDALWGDLSARLHEDTKVEREEIEKFRTPMFVSFAIAGFFYLVIWVAGGGVVSVIISIAVTIFAVYYFYHWHKAKEAYTRKVNKHIYQLVFRFFEIEGEYYGDDGEVLEANADERVKNILTESELITENTDTINVGDVFEAKYEGQELVVGELDVTRTEGSGKNRRVVQVFKGLFVQLQLRRSLNGKTFISTEGDTRGFGHRDFWGRVTGKSAVEETLLEWNEFENDLHVATSDGTEARYILTPDFMQDLHSWWKEHKRNIRFVFRGNKMSLLYPDRDIEVTSLPSANDTSSLKSYALTIIVPLWHVLQILEDIDTQFK